MKNKKLLVLVLVLAVSIPLNVFAGTTLGTNLIVGDGTPDVTQNGEDAYIEGTFEVDGASRFDGATTFNSTLTVGADDTGYDVVFNGATSGSNLTFDESADSLYFNDLTVASSSFDNGSQGGSIVLHHESASPALLDSVGRILFTGKSDNDADVLYSEIDAVILDASDGAEYGGFRFYVSENGSLTNISNLRVDTANSHVEFSLGTSNTTDVKLATSNDGSLELSSDGTGNLVLDSESGVVQMYPNSAATGGGAEAIRLGTGASGVLGVYFGSGVPTVSAPQGSLYLRTDGSSTSTRMYINTDGGTTWTNVVTAA